jgi:hypothetical protein
MVSASDVSQLVDFHLALRDGDIDSDNAFKAITLLCDGDQEALLYCTRILFHGPTVDPDNHPIAPLRRLNTMGILGRKIPLLWRISGRQVGRVLGVIRGCEFSICGMSGLLLNTSIHQGRLLADLDRVIAELRILLPKFNPNAVITT